MLVMSQRYGRLVDTIFGDEIRDVGQRLSIFKPGGSNRNLQRETYGNKEVHVEDYEVRDGFELRSCEHQGDYYNC
jgi:hypothetical protein